MNKQKGFTLIELIVVISIIGFIATAAIYSFSISRMKARDARRLSDMKQLQSSLALFYSHNNRYPAWPVSSTIPACIPCIENASASTWVGSVPFSPFFLNGFLIIKRMSELINPFSVDPTRAGTSHGYRYYTHNRDDSGATVNVYDGYTLLVRLEKNSNWCKIKVGRGYNNGINTYSDCY